MFSKENFCPGVMKGLGFEDGNTVVCNLFMTITVSWPWPIPNLFQTSFSHGQKQAFDDTEPIHRIGETYKDIT